MECVLEQISVHYEVYGEGRPIVLLHGWPADHHYVLKAMEPQFERRAGWRRIYLDLPGMGLTAGPDWITNQDQVLEVILAFIDTVIPDQRFVVAGFSYGGLVARGLVYRRAAWMDGLLLTVPVVSGDAAARHLPPKMTLVADPEFVAELEAAGAQDLIDVAVIQDRKMADALKDILPAVKRADHAFLERLAKAYAFSFDVDQLAQPFTGPTLILTGRQDHWCGYQDIWAVLEHYPRATFAVLDRAGHALWVEQEALFTTLTREWLDRVEELAAV